MSINITYRLPEFNLNVYIYHYPDRGPFKPSQKSPSVITVGNLAYGRRSNISSYDGYGSNQVLPIPIMTLLLPKGTDIRTGGSGITPGINDFVWLADYVGRYYEVVGVDDAGLGFPNEHRVAILKPYRAAWVWPLPGTPNP